MAGTLAGRLKARDTNLKNDPLFYKRIGAIGGRKGTTGGFAQDILCGCELIKNVHVIRQCAGKKGGRISRRTKAK